MDKFDIPESATLLREIDPSLLDLRTDAEIIAQLQKFQPITSEKNVFAIWDRGYHKMPPCHQNTVLNWVRRLGSSWTVHLIDFMDDSPTNIYNYVGKECFPECFVNKTMTGKHSPQHAADLARLPLIHQWGAPDTPYEMAAWIITGQIRNRDCDFGNFMFAARKGCEFLKKWHEGYLKLWEGRTNADGFHEHPLIQEIGLAQGLANPENENQVKFMTDYVAQMVIGDRTKNLLDVTDGWNGREFWEKKVYQVEGIQNGILGALRTNLDGQKQADYFTTRLDEPDLEKRAAAEEFALEMLEHSVMYKVWHNSMGDNPALGDLVKKKGNEDITHRPGTFGELYRYGTVHWESTRVIKRLEPKRGEDLQDQLIQGTPTMTAAEAKQ
ncbi:hypothetical protein ACHAPU_001067 [Fusarium lateritium]